MYSWLPAAHPVEAYRPAHLIPTFNFVRLREQAEPLIKVYSRESARGPNPLLFRGGLWNNRARHCSLFKEKWLMKCKVCLSSLGSNPLPDPERNSGWRTMELDCAGPQKAMACGWGRIELLLRMERLGSPSYLLISVLQRFAKKQRKVFKSKQQ